MDGTIRGECVLLCAATLDDLDVLVEMSREPSVAAWWDDDDHEKWRARLTDHGDWADYVVEVAGEPVGFACWYEETDATYRHAGIDLFLAAAHQGRGLGTDVVRTLARWLIEVRGHRRLVIDPAAANERAIACYRKVGFRPIGIARQSERTKDGAWRDQLLMDFLADELT